MLHHWGGLKYQRVCGSSSDLDKKFCFWRGWIIFCNFICKKIIKWKFLFLFVVILLQGFVILLAYWNRYVQYYNFPSWTFSVWAYLCFVFHRMLKEHWWSTPTLSTGNAIQQHRQHFWEYSDTKVEMKRGKIKSIYVVLLESLHFSILWLTLKFRDGRCRLWRCWVLVVVNLTSRLEQMVSPELLLLIVLIVEWRVLKTSHKFVCVIFVKKKFEM